MLQAFTSEPNTRIKNTVQQMFKIVAAWSLKDWKITLIGAI